MRRLQIRKSSTFNTKEQPTIKDDHLFSSIYAEEREITYVDSIYTDFEEKENIKQEFKTFNSFKNANAQFGDTVKIEIKPNRQNTVADITNLWALR
jgi:hypothetical protein